MNRHEVMLSYVPLYYHFSNLFKAILQVEGEEFDTLRTDVDDLKKQLFVDTATWGLQFWEKEFGLPAKSGLSYEERRSRVKGKVRGIGKVGSGLIRSVAESYSNGEVNVDFDGIIDIKFIGTRGIPTAITELEKQIEDIVPAHLMVQYYFTYLIWNEFENMTAAVQESMTWDQLEVYKPQTI